MLGFDEPASIQYPWTRAWMIAEKRYHVYMSICGTSSMLEHELKTMFDKFPEILQTPFGVCRDYLLHCAINLNTLLPVMKVSTDANR